MPWTHRATGGKKRNAIKTTSPTYFSSLESTRSPHLGQSMHGAGPKPGVKGTLLGLRPTRLGGSTRAAALLSARAPHHPQEAVLYPSLGLCRGSGHFFFFF